MTPETIVAIIGAVLGSSVISTILNRIFVITDKKSATSQAIKYSLLVNLQNECRRLISEKSFTKKDYDQVCEMYKIYKKLNGDGYADMLMDQVSAMFKNEIASGNV